jgi:hypothetical protein
LIAEHRDVAARRIAADVDLTGERHVTAGAEGDLVALAESLAGRERRAGHRDGGKRRDVVVAPVTVRRGPVQLGASVDRYRATGLYGRVATRTP